MNSAGNCSSNVITASWKFVNKARVSYAINNTADKFRSLTTPQHHSQEHVLYHRDFTHVTAQHLDTQIHGQPNTSSASLSIIQK